MTTTTTSKTSLAFRLGYVTDVEGNWEYFQSFVAQSRVLDVEEESGADDGSLNLRLRHDHCYFVYGGDAVDKGPGDLRLCRTLVRLKRRYPDRVFLLVGNRDLNKLRLTAELSQADLQRPLKDIPPPHWDPTAPTLTTYLQRRQREEKDAQGPCLDQLNTRVERLKYMLIHTLGCPDTFEFRRDELSLLQKRKRDAITDDEVVDNFLDEVVSGSLRQYLELANVAVIVGNTLFCHGAVDQATMKYVPRLDTKFENPAHQIPGDHYESATEWTAALNRFLQQGLIDFAARPHWNEDRTSRGGEALMALQNRPAVWGRSIVSNCYGDGGCITTPAAARERNHPERLQRAQHDPLAFEKVCSNPLDARVADWLTSQGICRVIVGHKPTGDCPAVLSSDYTGVEVVSADTSYAGGPNRGTLAVANVELVGSSLYRNRLELSGRLSTGQAYHCAFLVLESSSLSSESGGGVVCNNGASFGEEEIESDPNLGKRLPNGGWWMKARFVGEEEEDCYWLCRGEGRRVQHQAVPVSSLGSVLSTADGNASVADLLP